MDVEESVEISALSIEEAVLIGLTRLAATRDEVTIEVLDEGSRGFLGLGTRMARVKISRRDSETLTIPSTTSISEVINESYVQPSGELSADVDSSTGSPIAKVLEPENHEVEEDLVQPQEKAAVSAEKSDPDLLYQQVEETVHLAVEHLLSSLSITVSTEWRDEEDRPTLWVSIHGVDADSIVGPRAQTLNAVQYLFRTLVHRQVDGNYDLVVDADGYRQRRRRSLENIAQKNAEQAVQSGRTVHLRSMPAHERRIIHILLREDDRVTTRSVGTGRDRAITIIPNSSVE